jgi:DNA-binding transcriptional LysR family regulator
MVGPFLKRYPDIRLEVIDTSDLIDIVTQGVDAGIRYEENLARDMIAVFLGPPQRYVVVRLAALSRHVRSPDDTREPRQRTLHRHPLSDRCHPAVGIRERC